MRIVIIQKHGAFNEHPERGATYTYFIDNDDSMQALKQLIKTIQNNERKYHPTLQEIQNNSLSETVKKEAE